MNAFTLEYKGALQTSPGVPMDTSLLTGDIFQVKTTGVSISVNKTDMFPVAYDDIIHVNQGYSYTFNKECQLVLADVIGVV